jgi:hypothetical protein
MYIINNMNAGNFQKELKEVSIVGQNPICAA